MPAEFLSNAERAVYGIIPTQLPEANLLQYCYLTYEDKRVASGQRREENRLGFAVQLSVLRLMNYLPEQWWKQIPEGMLLFIAKQLSIPPAAFSQYGRREPTIYEHTQLLLSYLGLRRWQPLLDGPVLEKWLLERALEHDQERILLEMACQRLRQEHILRPAIVELERMVGSLAEQAHEETFGRMSNLVIREVKDKLDGLLQVEPSLGITQHNWLIRPPARSTPNAINVVIRKVLFLGELGVSGWDLSWMNPNRQKRLAQIVQQKTNQALQRFSEAKRYSLLVAFCKEMLIDLTDLVVKMFEELWEDTLAHSRQQLEFYQQSTAKTKDELLLTLGKAAGLVLDEENIPADLLREKIYDCISREELRKAIERVQVLTTPTKHSYLDFLENRYSHLKKCTANFLAHIRFANAFEGDDFFQALQIGIDLQTGKRKKLPLDCPTNFITPSWKGFVVENGKDIQKHPYELCVLATLRDRLRSGDVYLEGSRKYGPMDTYLIPPAQWAVVKPKVLELLPELTPDRLDQRIAELESHLPLMEMILQ